MQILIQSRVKYIFKATIFCIFFIGLLFLFTSSLNFLPRHLVPYSLEGIYHGIIGILVGLLTTKLFLGFDKKKFSDIGLSFERSTIVKFLAGAVIGVIIMGLLAGSVIYFTNTSIEVNQKFKLSQFLIASLTTFLLAFMEEIGFRAYPLHLLKNKVGIRIAIIITSILFAFSHIAYGWTPTSSLGPAIWGLLFGLSAIYSKGIAMPTGIHYAINLTTFSLGSGNNTVSIWTIKNTNSIRANYLGIDWVIILPHITLLVFAIICIELYMRRKTTANSTI